MYVCTIFFNLEYDKIAQRDKIRTLNFTRLRHDFSLVHIFSSIYYPQTYPYLDGSNDRSGTGMICLTP
jgi:hypothetical protein